MKRATCKTLLLVLTWIGCLSMGPDLKAQRFPIFGLVTQSWKYDQTNDNYALGLEWTLPEYDDSGPSWQTGLALISSDGNLEILPLRNSVIRDLRTALPGVPGSTANQAIYARTHFTWTGPVPPDVVLVFNARIDDGAAVYLNGNRVDIMPGQTVGRYRMGPTVAHNSFTVNAALVPCQSAITSNNDATCDEELIIDGTYLREGDNVLAVSAHQNNAGSSDVTWGTRLDGILPFAPIITDMLQPSNRFVLQTRSTTLHCIADGYPVPTFQWYHDDQPIDGGTNSTYTIVNATSADAGMYFCRATNSKGSADTRVAEVGYTEDGEPPVVVSASADQTFTKIIVQFNEVVDATTLDPFAIGVSDSLGNGYAVGSFIPNAGGASASINLGAGVMLPEDTVITVELNALTDLVGNPIADGTTFEIRSWVRSACSGVLFEAYGNTGSSTAVSALTGHPSFPNFPTFVANIDRFHTRIIYPDNPGNDNYGARLRALFVPLVSGNWRLFISTDDNAELYFNPNGSSPAGKILAAREPTCCQLYQAPGNVRTSDAYPLVAGRGYYVELLYKEGGGGDFGMVAARLDGAGIPTGGNDQGNELSESISGLFPSPVCTIGYGAVPPGSAGALAVTLQPADVSVEAVNTATFGVGADAPDSPYVCYQWQKSDDGGVNFFDIPGARGPTHTTGSLSVANDNGDMYRAIVSIPGQSETTSAALLTVTPDVTPPAVSVQASTTETNISVLFSEAMDQGALPQPGLGLIGSARYELNPPIPLLLASLNLLNPRQVDLVLAGPMNLGEIYTLTITDVLDPSRNPISPNPTILKVRAQRYPGNLTGVRVLPRQNVLPVGALVARGIPGRMVQVNAAIANANDVTEQLLNGTYPTAVNPLPNIAPQPVFFADIINFNRDAPTGASVGHLPNDIQFPGYPPAGTQPVSYENMGMEVVTYLELRLGIYRMGVSSDDGFRVSPALGPEDLLNGIVLGEFNGGRGVADTTFDFLAPDDGLYPFRLTWEQGGGGANVEWWVQDLDQVVATYYAVNAPAGAGGGGMGGGGPPAFVPPCTQPTLTIAHVGANVVIQWPIAGGGNLFGLQQASVLQTDPLATVWTAVPQVPQNVMGNKTVTIPATAAARFYRLFKPGPPSCP